MKKPFLAALFLLGLSARASAATPATLNYQGRMRLSSGAAVADSTSNSATFRLYTTVTGGSPIWAETQTSVTTTAGLFNVVLGSAASLNVPFDQQYYLEVVWNSPTEVMSPRTPLTAGPYAFMAKNLELPFTGSNNSNAPALSVTSNSAGPNAYAIYGTNSSTVPTAAFFNGGGGSPLQLNSLLFPSGTGSSGQVLTTNGSNQMSWASAATPSAPLSLTSVSSAATFSGFNALAGAGVFGQSSLAGGQGLYGQATVAGAKGVVAEGLDVGLSATASNGWAGSFSGLAGILINAANQGLSVTGASASNTLIYGSGATSAGMVSFTNSGFGDVMVLSGSGQALLAASSNANGIQVTSNAPGASGILARSSGGTASSAVKADALASGMGVVASSASGAVAISSTAASASGKAYYGRVSSTSSTAEFVNDNALGSPLKLNNMKFPGTDTGSGGKFLSTDGAGNLAWASATSSAPLSLTLNSATAAPLYVTNATGTAIVGTGHIGLSVTSSDATNGTAIIARSNATGGSVIIATSDNNGDSIFGESQSGYGISGLSSTNAGVYGTSNGGNAPGVWGQVNSTGMGVSAVNIGSGMGLLVQAVSLGASMTASGAAGKALYASNSSTAATAELINNNASGTPLKLNNMKFPSTDLGLAGTFLGTDGAGNLTWTTASFAAPVNLSNASSSTAALYAYNAAGSAVVVSAAASSTAALVGVNTAATNPAFGLGGYVTGGSALRAGVIGSSNGSSPAPPIASGVFGYGPTGAGVFGLVDNPGNSGSGLYAQNTGASNVGYGVRAENSSLNGVGVLASNSSASGLALALSATSASSAGMAILATTSSTAATVTLFNNGTGTPLQLNNMKFPSTDSGFSGKVLGTDGLGNLTWTTATVSGPLSITSTTNTIPAIYATNSGNGTALYISVAANSSMAMKVINSSSNSPAYGIVGTDGSNGAIRAGVAGTTEYSYPSPPSIAGVYGYSSTSAGVAGVVDGPTNQGQGLLGKNLGITNTGYGVRGENVSVSGAGVLAYNTAGAGLAVALSATTLSPAGEAIYANISSSSATAEFINNNPGGTPLKLNNMKFPSSDAGLPGTFLGTDGAGNLAWSNIGGTLFGGNVGKIPYWNSSLSLGNSGMSWDNTNGRLGLGVAAPLTQLHLANDGFNSLWNDSSGGSGSFFTGRGSRGTLASPASSQTGDILAAFSARGFGSGSFASQDGAAIMMRASQNWNISAQGTTMGFWTTSNGSNLPAEHLTLDGAGNLGVGTTSPSSLFDLNGALTQRAMTAPAVSGAGQGRIYFDSPGNHFMVSENGGAYTVLGALSAPQSLTTTTGTSALSVFSSTAAGGRALYVEGSNVGSSPAAEVINNTANHVALRALGGSGTGGIGVYGSGAVGVYGFNGGTGTDAIVADGSNGAGARGLVAKGVAIGVSAVAFGTGGSIGVYATNSQTAGIGVLAESVNGPALRLGGSAKIDSAGGTIVMGSYVSFTAGSNLLAVPLVLTGTVAFPGGVLTVSNNGDGAGVVGYATQPGSFAGVSTPSFNSGVSAGIKGYTNVTNSAGVAGYSQIGSSSGLGVLGLGYVGIGGYGRADVAGSKGGDFNSDALNGVGVSASSQTGTGGTFNGLTGLAVNGSQMGLVVSGGAVLNNIRYPSFDGGPGQVLTTNGAGQLSFTSAGVNAPLTLATGYAGSILTLTNTGTGFGMLVQASNATGVSSTGGSKGVQGYGGSSGVEGFSSGGYGVYGGSQTGYGVQGTVTGAGTAGVSGDGGPTGRGVAGNGTGGYGVYGTSTSNNGIFGDVGNNFAGVYGQNTSSGYGVKGTSNNGEGVYGQVSAAGLYGVHGLNFGNGPGVFAESGGASGIGLKATANGIGVLAQGLTGVAGLANGANGVGVLADWNNTVSGFALKVSGPAQFDSGTTTFKNNVDFSAATLTGFSLQTPLNLTSTTSAPAIYAYNNANGTSMVLSSTSSGPAATLVVKNGSSFTNAYGIWAAANGTAGNRAGVLASSESSFTNPIGPVGVYGYSNQGNGVQAYVDGASNSAAAVRAQNTMSTGYGVVALNSAASGAAVALSASALSSTGIGGYFSGATGTVMSGQAYGLIANANSGGAGYAIGVAATTADIGGYGVLAQSTNKDGQALVAAIGATGNSTFNDLAALSATSNLANGLAGYFGSKVGLKIDSSTLGISITAGTGKAIYASGIYSVGPMLEIRNNSTTSNGQGILATSAGGYAVFADSSSPIAPAIFARNTNSNDGILATVSGSSAKAMVAQGIAVGVSATASGATGVAVYGSVNNANSNTGAIVGINSASAGAGVYGQDTATGSFTTGVWGEGGAAGAGVYGHIAGASATVDGRAGVAASNSTVSNVTGTPSTALDIDGGISVNITRLDRPAGRLVIPAGSFVASGDVNTLQASVSLFSYQALATSLVYLTPVFNTGNPADIVSAQVASIVPPNINVRVQLFHTGSVPTAQAVTVNYLILNTR